MKTLTLSDGRVAEIRTPKGRDMRNANRVAAGDEMGMVYAVIASCTTIGGVQLVMEDVDDMELSDITMLTQALNLGNVPSSTTNT